MADEKPVEQPVVEQPPVEAAAVVEAPVVEAKVADAPVSASDAPPAAEAPKVEPSLLETLEAPADPAKPVEAKPEEKPAEPPAEKPAGEKAPEEKPVEAAKTEEAPKIEEKLAEAPVEAKVEEKPVEPPKLEPVEYKYEIPEQITLPDERRAELHGALDAFRADPVAGAQKLLDMHAQAMVEHDARLRQDQFRIFGETKQQWRTQAMADEQIGGAAWDTSSKAIARMRDQFVSASPRGTPEYDADRASFVEMLTLTGAGDHPAMLKFLHNVAQRFDEPAVPVIADVKLVPDKGVKPGSNPLHDHPRSQNLNGRQ